MRGYGSEDEDADWWGDHNLHETLEAIVQDET